jgi:hypothetical protein
MKNLIAVVFVCCFTFSVPLTLWGDIRGDVNNDKKIDVSETIYSLKVASGLVNPFPDSEIEPNNTLDTATPLELDNSVAVRISEKNDSDCFKFFLSKDGVLDILLTSMPENIDAELTLYNHAKEKIKTFRGDTGIDCAFEYLLDAGTYYLELYDDNMNAFNEASFELRATLDTTDIHENNNSFSKATAIEIGETVQGAIRSVGDRECELLIPEGVYYLRLFDYKYGSSLNASHKSLYNLKLEFDTSDAHENNNSFSQAANINIGEAVQGAIRSVGDSDYFKFEVPRDGVLDIFVTSVPDNIRMSLELYDESKTEVKHFYASAAGGDRECELLIPEGVYYLRLFDYKYGSSLDASKTWVLIVQRKERRRLSAGPWAGPFPLKFPEPCQ